MRSLLQSGKVRNALQPQGSPEIGQVAQLLGNSPVVRLEEGLQDQTGEQLGLGIEFGTIAMRIERKGVGSNGQRLFRNAHRRLAGDAHLPLYVSSCP